MKKFYLSVYQAYFYLLLVELPSQRVYLQISTFRVVSIQQFLEIRKILLEKLLKLPI